MTTVADVVTAVRSLAQAQPDRVESNSYVDNNKPMCIIGEALVDTGTPVANLYDLLGPVSPYVLRQAGVEVDETEDRTNVNWLWMVQDNQDAGDDWYTAVAKSDRAALTFGWSV